MADERAGTCTITACDGSCPPDKVETYRTAAGCAADKFARRCCSPGSYPDVLVMVDKGGGENLPYRAYGNSPKMQTADYSLLEGYWTNVKTVKALPGAQQQSAQPRPARTCMAQPACNFMMRHCWVNFVEGFLTYWVALC